MLSRLSTHIHAFLAGASTPTCTPEPFPAPLLLPLLLLLLAPLLLLLGVLLLPLPALPSCPAAGPLGASFSGGS